MVPLAWLVCSQGDLPEARAWLADTERDQSEALRYPKRRAEFLLRRWTAKRALAAALGIGTDPESLARLEARSAPDGAPEPFLDGAALRLGLSLSDRAGHALCVVDSEGAATGCDLELVERRSAVFVHDWFTQREQGLVADAGDEVDLVANLVWSAKESALKVLRTGLRRDTRSVEVHLDPDTSYDAKGWSALTVHVDDGRVLPGWWRACGGFVLTVASERAQPAPRQLRNDG